MDSRRIFLALDISDAARRVCDVHIQSLRRKFSKVRVGWERAEKLHITLQFLGETSGETLDGLQSGISEIAARHERIQLRISRPGVFPSRARPRILWIGLDDPMGAVTRLHTEIDQLCGNLGFELENKTFRPHITIARMREPQAGLATTHLETHVESVEFEVAEIVVYESNLKATGSEYSLVSSAPLQGSAEV